MKMQKIAVVAGLYFAVRKIDDLRHEIWYLEDQMSIVQTHIHTPKDCWK